METWISPSPEPLKRPWPARAQSANKNSLLCFWILVHALRSDGPEAASHIENNTAEGDEALCPCHRGWSGAEPVTRCAHGQVKRSSGRLKTSDTQGCACLDVHYNGLYHEKVLEVNLAVCLGVLFHTSPVDSSPLPDFPLRLVSDQYWNDLPGIPLICAFLP